MNIKLEDAEEQYYIFDFEANFYDALEYPDMEGLREHGKAVYSWYVSYEKNMEMLVKEIINLYKKIEKLENEISNN